MRSTTPGINVQTHWSATRQAMGEQSLQRGTVQFRAGDAHGGPSDLRPYALRLACPCQRRFPEPAVARAPGRRWSTLSAVRAPTARRSTRGMVISMATTKVTITIEDDQLEGVRRLVAAGKASSVSGFVKHAVGVALHDAAGWQEMLKGALRQTGGPLTDAERAWADALLTPRSRKRRGRRTTAA